MKVHGTKLSTTKRSPGAVSTGALVRRYLILASMSWLPFGQHNQGTTIVPLLVWSGRNSAAQ